MKHIREYNTYDKIEEISTMPYRDVCKIEELSEYLQELFDRYHLRHNTFGSVPNSWSITNVCLHIVPEDKNIQSSIYSEILKLRPHLERRLLNNKIVIEKSAMDSDIYLYLNKVEKKTVFNKIKRFLHISESKKEQYYNKITGDEYASLLHPGKSVNLTSYEVDELIKIDDEFSFTILDDEIQSIYYNYNTNEMMDITISKIKDEYFLIELITDEGDQYHYYKCDQIDGVLYFLSVLKNKCKKQIAKIVLKM